MLSNHFEIIPGPIPTSHAALLPLLNRLDTIPPIGAPGVISIKEVADHSPDLIPIVSLLWQCATVGYGTFADIGLLQNGGAALPLAQRVWLSNLASSRTTLLLQTLLTVPTLVGQPEVNGTVGYMESSEKRWASELLGLVFAQVVACKYLPLATPRLYYVGLYSTLAPAGIVPVTLNAGLRRPDFISPSPNLVDWHVVEAKGTCGDFPRIDTVTSGFGQLGNVDTVNGNPPISRYISTTYTADYSNRVATSFFRIPGGAPAGLGGGGGGANPFQLAWTLLGLSAVACRYLLHSFGLEMNHVAQLPVLVTMPGLRIDTLVHPNFITLTNNALNQLQAVPDVGDIVTPLANLGEAIFNWEANLNPLWWIDHADNRAWTPLENGWLAGAVRPGLEDL